MNPLILSLVCLLSIAVSGNFLGIVKNSKTLLYISIIPCIYIIIYGVYLTFGPIDLYEDGTKNFYLKNPEENELPIVFILLKFYQYILIVVGSIFSFVFLRYLKKY